MHEKEISRASTQIFGLYVKLYARHFDVKLCKNGIPRVNTTDSFPFTRSKINTEFNLIYEKLRKISCWPLTTNLHPFYY